MTGVEKLPARMINAQARPSINAYRPGLGNDASQKRVSRGSAIVAIVFLSSFLCPSDLTVKLGPTLTLLRFTLLVLLFPAVLRLFKKVTSGQYVPVASDMMVVLLVIWMHVALVATGGVAALTTTYGLRIYEFLSAYLIGRCYFADRISLERFVQVLVVVCALMLIIGLVDTISGRNVFGQLARGKMADPNVFGVTTQFRFGLARARGPLEHSIIYGLYFAICATLIYFLARPLRLKLVGLAVCVAGTLIALSSAPMLSLSMFAALAVYDRLLSGTRWRWRALLGAGAYGVAVIFILSEDPIDQLIRTFTLDPETGLYRLLIWKWVAYSIESSPLFGIGLGDWTRLSAMTPSVDALWLNEALRAGYVGVVLLAGTVIGAFFVITPRRLHPLDTYANANSRTAVTIVLFQMLFASITVHFWGSSWAMFALMIGVRAGLSEERYLAGPSPWHITSSPRPHLVPAIRSRVLRANEPARGTRNPATSVR